MAVLPQSRPELVAWFEARLPVWAVNPTGIGLTAAQVSDMAGLVAAARTALTDQTNATNVKLAATGTMHVQTDAVRSFGGDLIKVIKNYADLTSNPLVYDQAQVPPPSPPTPAGPPPQPTELSAGVLLPFGIGLRWKGSVSQSAYFGIYRQLPGESSFSLIDTSKTKSYEDTTVPAGTARADYYIAALRDEYQVNSAALTVQFGPGGTMVATLAMAA